MAIMGAPRKYKTAAALRKAVASYFNSISRTVTPANPDGTPMLNDDGEPIKIRRFVKPPSLASMCVHLGIVNQTWQNYSDHDLHPEFAEVTAQAKQMIEAYLSEEVTDADRRNVNGIMFTLTNNYGWKNKSEVEVGEETRKVAERAVPQLGLSEKIAAIAAAQAAIASQENDGNVGDGD